MPKKQTATSNESHCSSAFMVKGASIESKRKVSKTLGVFSKRQQARQWCRNHRFDFTNMIIVHPDGTRESFAWKGIA